MFSRAGAVAKCSSMLRAPAWGGWICFFLLSGWMVRAGVGGGLVDWLDSVGVGRGVGTCMRLYTEDTQTQARPSPPLAS